MVRQALLTPVIFLSLLGLSAPARANPTRPNVQFVSNLADAGQALVKDRTRGTYVLVRLGDTIQGYQISGLDNSELTLQDPIDSSRQYILAATTHLMPSIPGPTSAPVRAQSAPSSGPGAIVVIPASPAATVLLDPYQTPQEVPADIELPSTPPTRSRQPATLRPTIVGPDSNQVSLQEETQLIDRDEFDRALSDFHRLSKEAQLVRNHEGIEIAGLSRGSFFYRLGLRKGDLIRKVDGTTIQDLDGAAAVYARLLSAPEFLVELKRGDSRILRRYRFRSGSSQTN